jgi:ubiquinone biosynthesis accessory factor UbiJ
MASPLEVLLRPVAEMLNRNIAATTPARALAADLNGSTVAVRARDTGLHAYFTFADDSVALHSDYDADPDVAISASLITLTRMLGGAGEAAIRDGDVDLTGDAVTAQRFQKLLGYARPDAEEEISRVVGDVAAHQLAGFARGVASWARQARSTMGSNVREYLQEESRELPTRYEVDRFATKLGVLRDDVDRLAARLRRLEGQD